MRERLVWDSNIQNIEVAFGNCLTLGIIDSWAFHNIMDENMARTFNLPVVPAYKRDYGMYCVARTTMMHYSGRVECPAKVRLGPHVSFTIKGMRVVKYPHPLLLIDTDILTRDHPPD